MHVIDRNQSEPLFTNHNAVILYLHLFHPTHFQQFQHDPFGPLPINPPPHHFTWNTQLIVRPPASMHYVYLSHPIVIQHLSQSIRIQVNPEPHHFS